MNNILSKKLFSVCLLLSAFGLSPMATAATPEVMPDPFPQSSLETTTTIRSPGHLVLFSPVREVNDEIRSETMARLPVQGEGRLYEIARDSSRAKARIITGVCCRLGAPRYCLSAQGLVAVGVMSGPIRFLVSAFSMVEMLPRITWSQAPQKATAVGG